MTLPEKRIGKFHPRPSAGRRVYAEALATTEYLEARRGQVSFVKILPFLARNKMMNEALKAVVGLDCQEFQTTWEADLDRFRPRGH